MSRLVTSPLVEDTVVIGGSIAGLTAASILARHSERVTILERDGLAAPGEFRPGVPQARQAHTLLPEGLAVFEQLFPGLTDELVAEGAVPVDPASEMVMFVDGVWRAPRNREAGRRVTFSRPLLEAVLRRRLAARPNVVLLTSQDVVGLCTDSAGGRVAGVRLRRRGALGDGIEELPAQLVLDASGRSSPAPRWLAELGFTPPRETIFATHTGYASRVYRRPEGFAESWKTLYIRPRAPAATRGGLLLPVEGGRWLLTLIGAAGDYPPADVAGFEAFAAGLPSPRFSEIMQQAEPLDEPFRFQSTESRLRRFHQMRRYLEGFLVSGDAVMTLNPVYALGMTAAGLGSLALDACLQGRQTLDGLAGAFQAQLAEATARMWAKVTAEDIRWPMTEVTETGVVSEWPELAPAGSRSGAAALAEPLTLAGAFG